MNGLLLDQTGRIIFASKTLQLPILSKVSFQLNPETTAARRLVRLSVSSSGPNIYRAPMYFQRTTKLDFGWTLFSLQDESILARQIQEKLILFAVVLFLIALIAEYLSRFASRTWARPLNEFTDMIRALPEHLDRPIRLSNQEIPEDIHILVTVSEWARTQLSRSGSELKAMVALKTRELEQSNQQLEKMAIQDPLTGLPNRRAFERKFKADWHQARRQDFNLSLIILDIDHFKLINDRFGHPVGDQVLCAIATTLLHQIRRDTDQLSRIGGEEFAVLLPGTSAQDATALAETLRQHIESSTIDIGEEQPLKVSISAGIATSLKPERSTKGLYLRADRALYQAKRSGRNQVICDDPDTSAASPPGV